MTPAVIALLAVPSVIQVYFNATLAYWLRRGLGVEWWVSRPSALIGASNLFELAVAARRLQPLWEFLWKCRSCSPSFTSFAVLVSGMSGHDMGGID